MLPLKASLPSCLLTLGSLAIFPAPGLAQIIPDQTLGTEASSLTIDQMVRGDIADLIEGGATRGSNLFHSFSEFNVNASERVYFLNPAGIDSILSRITGNNPSEIFGTLGVEGPADLFLMNPNGLIFGENVLLDVDGSFYGTTATAIEIEDGVFSAVEPERSQLLAVSPSVSFWNYLTEDSGDIIGQGTVAIGGDLVLAGNSLDLRGQLAAVGDIALLATDTMRIRDSAQLPFIGFAGGNLLVQGNQQVDIVALHHPNSGLYSYGDMVLRAAERIVGDTHYLSGGAFRVEQLDGSVGELFSPIDPIIRALGDVTIGTYEGSSLHILAGGAVAIGTAEIIAREGTNIDVDFLQETITLSDGTIVKIDGNAQPTLDVRAGVRPEAIGAPPLNLLTGFNGGIDDFSDNSVANQLPTSANITIGDVALRVVNGVVLLTNQYAPNLDLPGGNVVVTGDGDLGFGINAQNFAGLGGAVYLDAHNNIDILNSVISTAAAANVRDVVIAADGTVKFDGLDGTRATGVFSNIAANVTGTGGDIRITARNLQVLGGAQLSTSTIGEGTAGNVILEIDEMARFEGSNPSNGLASGAFSSIQPNGTGTGGDVRITARNLQVLQGAQLGAGTFGKGTAGNIILEIDETARFEGSNPSNGNPSGVLNNIGVNGTGTGGDVRINARNLQVLEGAQLSAGNFGEGSAGSVILEIDETARFEGSDPRDRSASGAFSSIQLSGTGKGGDVRITARNLQVLGGAQLSAGTLGEGIAGSIILDIDETARFAGSDPENGSPSGAFSSIDPNGVGTGGDVRITARNLQVLQGALLIASTFGEGKAGSVILEIDETARFEGSNPSNDLASGALSNIELGGMGESGDVRITARNLQVLGGAQLSADTLGEGIAGNVILLIEETARFEGSDPRDNSPSGVLTSIQPSGNGEGGDIRLEATDVEIINGAALFAGSIGQGNAGDIVLAVRNSLTARDGAIATTADQDAGGQIQISAGNIFLFSDSDIQTFVNSGDNNGGNITINANVLIALDDSDILAFAADGRGGDVNLNQTAFFGQNFQFAPPGTDPRTLDNNDRVDINATGGIASGMITLADTSFVQNSLTDLPDNLVNPETLVATSCVVRDSNTASSFTITGSDSLREQPHNSTSTYSLDTVQPVPGNPDSGLEVSEPQGAYPLENGRLVLGRPCATENE
ncbi:two-partner secretion domain-containing protein [Leptothoe spongobia]|uniref:Filamentous hemagglutinin N-terminal domain-containing protein n=1 Tax=Leptothoe spongobia TAU-MAC 1115 TaxID=1967444 RepID=A0A947DDW3_9CYAN|nr:filamentous hemagglutinin N-terminal domain-containing protein [Leptothoe spongobia]MBT9315050.1 filamentous hemagglutinin N-terminal domain-containing protein [Leptothoe spongobia TAU-MAC 1115]